MKPNNVMQLSGSVAAHLREQIISGKLKPGEFLRIDTIANEMGVSTTPVREGLLLLQSESFVRLLPRRGFVVVGFSKDDLRDLFWAQAVIGAELAARAAVRLSKDGIARVMQLVADHTKAFNEGDERVVRLGHEFHRQINLAAESPRLALLLGSLTKQLPNRFYASIEGQLSETIEYHPIIADAIRMKDAEAVRSLMFRHIMSSANHLIESLERAGTWASSEEAASARQRENEPVPVASAKTKAANTKTGRAKSARSVPAEPVRAKGAPVKSTRAAAPARGRTRATEVRTAKPGRAR